MSEPGELDTAVDDVEDAAPDRRDAEPVERDPHQLADGQQLRRASVGVVGRGGRAGRRGGLPDHIEALLDVEHGLLPLARTGRYPIRPRVIRVRSAGATSTWPVSPVGGLSVWLSALRHHGTDSG